MISRKQLEIELSQSIESFLHPKIDLEQYQTPPRIAANLLHYAFYQGDIEDKRVIDICAGTGILGIGAAILGANVTFVEIDPMAVQTLMQNTKLLDLENTKVITGDIFELDLAERFDTALLNPPFGIQQKKKRDIHFIQAAMKRAPVIYSIHDGSPANQKFLPQKFEDLGLQIVSSLLDEFKLPKTYPFHQLTEKIHRLLIIHSQSDVS